MNKVLLSFDLEEFDIPEEYGQTVPEDVQLKVSHDGLENLLALLEKLEIRTTFFVTAHFALHYQETIKKISRNHEIASHGCQHSNFKLSDLEKSKVIIESIIGKDVFGFRMARMEHVNTESIESAGYIYNASFNPTYLPGRYNNFFEKRTYNFSNTILNIPASVTSIIRFPLFWLSFKNIPLSVINYFSRQVLKKEGYLSIYFHPWEFVDIRAFALPFYIKRKSGQQMLLRLERYLANLKKHATFITHREFTLDIKDKQQYKEIH